MPENQTTVTNTNPLSSFFRKSKFKITIPSNGKWNNSNDITFGDNNTLDVFAMTATDDMKFRAGEANLSGQNTYELIKNCIPQIVRPAQISTVDIDAVILSIRCASYGPEFTVNAQIPNTTKIRKIDVNINDLLESLPTIDSWDPELHITSDDGQILKVFVKPLILADIFKTSKTIMQSKNTMQKAAENDLLNDVNAANFESGVHKLNEVVINMICESISKIELNEITEENPKNIKNLVQNLDVAYFNAIRDHIDVQKNKFKLFTPIQYSTPDEIKIGALEQWKVEVGFSNSNFFTR